jgi:hypothetical protein
MGEPDERFHLIPKENVKTVDGWKGLIEDFAHQLTRSTSSIKEFEILRAE